MHEPEGHREELLRLLLEHADEPCPGCGYSLKGLQGQTCPECGEALRLRVGMVEPRLGMFLCGLIGLAFGAGFHGILLIWAGSMVLLGAGGPRASDFVPIFIGLGSCGAGLVLWLLARAKIRHASAPVRLLLVAGCWVLSGATALAFMILVG